MAQKEIFLQVNNPEGRRIREVDPVTRKIDYKKPWLRIFPLKPTLVSELVAKRLIEQDPHLVGYEKFIAPPEPANLNVPMNDEDKAEFLILRAKKCLEAGPENLTIAQAKDWLNKLEIKVHPGTKKLEKLQDALVKGLEEILGTELEEDDDFDGPTKQEEGSTEE